MDSVDPATRRRTMQAVRSTNTKPERLVFDALKKCKVYFASHVKTLPGKPDIVFRRKRVTVFIDSDFWHGHPTRFRAPQSNVDYWDAKIARNRARDLAVTAELTQKDWTVLRLWEWDIRHGFDAEFARILSAVGREDSQRLKVEGGGGRQVKSGNRKSRWET